MKSLFLERVQTYEEVSFKDLKVPYTFSYSVAEKTLNRFDNILKTLMDRGVSFTSRIDGFAKDEIIKSIRFEPSNEFKHSVHNTEFLQRVYNFNGINIFHLLYFGTCVQDTVDIIQKYYNYDENGNEICNIKYKIGSIVSLIDDLSSDYFVQSIIYNLDELQYALSKIESNNTNTILFGETKTYNERSICNNRDDRINTILN